MVKKVIQGVAGAVPGTVGIPRQIQAAFFRKNLTVLTYHLVVDQPFAFPDWCVTGLDSFAGQLRYLAKHFEILPLEAGVKRCLRGDLRRPAAAVTFDDGYQCVCDAAFPVLREMGVPATVFLNTGMVDTGDTTWFGRLNTALARSREKGLFWRGRNFEIETPGDKGRASRDLQALLKRLPPGELAREVREIARALGDDPERRLEESDTFRMLGSRSIRAMGDSGVISFGAHTRTHTILSLLPAVEQEDQIRTSLEDVERMTGKKCRLFAYPNGRREDYDDGTIELLRRYGVRMAFTSVDGAVKPGAPEMELRRLGVGGHWSAARFGMAVHSPRGNL